VDGITLNVQRGEFFCVLGPNAAGKTTTIKMLVGLIRPTRGSARIAGFDVQAQPLEARRRLAYVPDFPFLYDKLTPWEFLRFTGQLFQMEERNAGRPYCGSELKNSDGCFYKDKCQNVAVHFNKAQEPKTIPICHAERDHGKCKKADCKYSHTSSSTLTSAQEVKNGFELLTELDNEITPAEITPAEIIPAEIIPAEIIPAETISIEPTPIKPAPIERINAHQDVKTQLLPKKTRRGWGN
jgi:ABC-type sugar transport system ATPase subunit